MHHELVTFGTNFSVQKIGAEHQLSNSDDTNNYYYEITRQKNLCSSRRRRTIRDGIGQPTELEWFSS